MFENLIKWSKQEFKALPWRKNRTLYTTLVSEIMLQQTTVPTVKNKFNPFLKQFPTLHALAQATDAEVCIAWKGLGYYSRARNLKKAAMEIVKNHKARVPKDYDSLKALTGIGEYTANSILSIGHKKRHLALDANIERVLCRLLGLKLKKGPKLKKELGEYLEKVNFLDTTFDFCPRELNEALMDLGRVNCQANTTNCENCHLKNECVAFKLGNPLSYPVPQKKIKKNYSLDLLRIILIDKDKILVHKRQKGQWLSDQWELPTFILNSEDKKLSQYPKLQTKIKLDENASFKTTITKYKINNFFVELSKKEFKKMGTFHDDYKFIKLDTINQNFTTATLKALRMGI